MTNKFACFRYQVLIVVLLLVAPVYTNIAIKSDWVWLASNTIYVSLFLYFLPRLSPNIRWVVFLSSLAPFLFFSVLLLISYFVQGTGFNEAYNYHFNAEGLVGYELIAGGVVGLLFLYYLLIIYLITSIPMTIKPLKLQLFGVLLLLMSTLFSRQILSYSYMYMEANHNDFYSQYIAPTDSVSEDAFREIAMTSLQPLNYDKPAVKPRNLVFIYAESLESGFYDSNQFRDDFNALKALEANSIVFNNLIQTRYTGWTIAGMVASLCGYPLQMPIKSSVANFNLSTEFMVNAECITDILKKENYTLTFSGGANLNFAGKRAFLESHAFDDIKGSEYYQRHYPKNPDDYNQWGLRDRLLFDSAYSDFVELSKRKQPFAQFLLTLDTHAPGFPDPECTHRYQYIKNNKMLDAAYCGTRYIKKFIDNIRNSPYSDDTIIVVMSDHLAHKNTADVLLEKTDRKLHLIVNLASNERKLITHRGTHYDVGPTILQTLGFDNCNPLGFGRNMLPCKDSDAERNGYLHHLFPTNTDVTTAVTHKKIRHIVKKKWGRMYSQMLDSGIKVDTQKITIEIGGKTYSYRHPQPFRTNETGSLVFSFDEAFRIKNIVSLKDYLRYPNNFSIANWLANKHGWHLYIGKTSALALTDIKSENMVAFIDKSNNKIYPMELLGNIDMSTNDIRDFVSTKGLPISSIQPISLLSCIEVQCQSHIAKSDNYIKLLGWGLSVWQVDENNSIRLMAEIDHCGDRESFMKKPSLKKLVNNARQNQQKKLLILGRNSVFCDPKQDLINWLQPFKLNKLKGIGFMQPYIGIINLTDDSIKEYTQSPSIQVDVSSNTEPYQYQLSNNDKHETSIQ